MIELTIEEARAIVEKAVELSPIPAGLGFSDFPAEMQLQAISGALNVIKGMQALGWTVERPKT